MSQGSPTVDGAMDGPAIVRRVDVRAKSLAEISLDLARQLLRRGGRRAVRALTLAGPGRDASDSADRDGLRRAPSSAEMRESIIRLAFGGEAQRFETFVQALGDGLPPHVTVVVRGSAVTGQRWRTGEPFDVDGPGTSDIDLALLGRGAFALWRADAMYIPRLYSVALDDAAPDVAPALVPLRHALRDIAGRPVSLQASARLIQYGRRTILDQPYYTVVDDTGMRG